MSIPRQKMRQGLALTRRVMSRSILGLSGTSSMVSFLRPFRAGFSVFRIRLLNGMAVRDAPGAFAAFMKAYGNPDNAPEEA